MNKEERNYFDKNDPGYIVGYSAGYKAAIDERIAELQKKGQYNPAFCYGYSKEHWNTHVEPKLKNLFGHDQAYTIEQYISGLIAMIKEIDKL